MRIGIIGAGAVARHHAIAASHISGLKLTAVCDLRSTAAHDIADEWDAEVFTDYRELLESSLVDAVVVNTPHALHREMVLHAAANGIHVLVEKPMATTLEDCEAMEAACKAAGITLVVGLIQHFLPEKLAVERALAVGDLGGVLAVHDHRSTDYRPGTRPAWFFDHKMAGGGAFMNIGGHCLDRSLWFGSGLVLSVESTLLKRFGAPVETDGRITLQLSSGAEVNICISSDTPRHIDELVITCEHGIITADPRTGTYLRRNGSTTVLHEHSETDIQDGFTLQLGDFVQAVAGAASKVSLTHAKRVVQLVLAAYESARKGMPVAPDARETQEAQETPGTSARD